MKQAPWWNRLKKILESIWGKIRSDRHQGGNWEEVGYRSLSWEPDFDKRQDFKAVPREKPGEEEL